MKVNEALVCLNCDELHSETVCPNCLSPHHYPLRKWLQPLNTFEALRQEVMNEQKNKISFLAGERSFVGYRYFSGSNIDSAPPFKKIYLDAINKGPPGIPEGSSWDHQTEPSKPEADKGDDNGGVELESQRDIERRGGGVNAGEAGICPYGWFRLHG